MSCVARGVIQVVICVAFYEVLINNMERAKGGEFPIFSLPFYNYSSDFRLSKDLEFTHHLLITSFLQIRYLLHKRDYISEKLRHDRQSGLQRRRV